MRPISAERMLDAWDRANGFGPARRAIEVLRAAYPEEVPESLAALSIGARDARLLTVREGFFGSRMESQTTCPQCAEHVEATFCVEDIRVGYSAEPAVMHEGVFDGAPVTFRLPDSSDLQFLERGKTSFKSEEEAKNLLLRRCILSGPDELSVRAEEELAEQMGKLDLQADTRLALECPACSHHWIALFDIGEFLWREIHAWAKRILQEVHTLASAYGWNERDILSMSAVRRALYLEMAQR